MSDSPQKQQAFTLIELIIVVAVVAILSAIALPNYVESQTRARISRVKADMRSLALSIESFKVENNQYPTGPAGPSNPPYPPEFIWGTQALSTPVAFIHDAYPRDPFHPPNTTNIPTGSGGSYPVQSKRDLSYQYSLRNEANEGTTGLATGNGPGVWWVLVSVGPDMDMDAYSDIIGNNDFGASADITYDPTNGSVSDGNLYFTGGYRGNSQVRSILENKP